MLELPNDSTQVWGHRGASAHAPENTGEAFRLAREQGADGVELDVRRTRDGALVIHHDAVTGSGRIIVEHTAEEIRRLEPGMLTLEEAMAPRSRMAVLVVVGSANRFAGYARLVERARAGLGELGAQGSTRIAAAPPAARGPARGGGGHRVVEAAPLPGALGPLPVG